MKEFEEKRKEIEGLHAPEDFELRLRTKLASAPKKKKHLVPWLIAAAVIFLAFATFNYQALAFYGKTLFGYEELMSDTVQQLNDEGYGQQVEKTFTMDDGTIFEIDGIMSSQHQFEIYYSIAEGDGSTWDHLLFQGVSGFFTNARPQSGVFNLEKQKGIQTFDRVNAFAKELTVELWYKQKDYAFTIPYEANKAIPNTLKKRINETIKLDVGTLKLKTLTATKGTTRIEGTLKEKVNRNINYDLSQIILKADGKEIPHLGAGMRSTFSSTYKFEANYEGLPETVENLTIELREFNGKKSVNQSIPVQKGVHKVGPSELEIISVEQIDGKTYIRIASERTVLYDGVKLQTTTGETALHGTESYEEAFDMKERTLLFDTAEEAKAIVIENVYYQKPYMKKIEIPLK